MVTDQIEKAVNPSGFKAAWSLGRSQRAIRNQATRSAWGETRSSIKAMKSAKTPDEINNIQSASQKKINEIGRDYVQGRGILRADQKKLNPAARVASNVAQYPLRWSAGTATAGATGYGVNRKVKKNEDIDKAAKKPTEKQKNAMLKGALVGGGVGTLVLPGLGTAGGAYIGYRHQGKKVGVYKSDNMSAFGVVHPEAISKKQCACDCDQCKTSCGCDCKKCVAVSKAFGMKKTLKATQVANQMRKVGEQKGSKAIQLRHAKRVASEKFQNK